MEHHWSVAWEMAPGTTQTRHTLSHPSVHVSFDGRRATVTGPTQGRFSWTLEGTGRVFATKFLPGAFRPLLTRGRMVDLVDAVVDLHDVVNPEIADACLAAMTTSEGVDDRDDVDVSAVEGAWAAALPTAPPTDQALLMQIVDLTRSDRTLTRVEDLVDVTGLHLRELQRFCKEALGISPRWLIRRYRLHDALQALDEGRDKLADLAARLGYADQAHFSRDFKAVVGVTPSRYLKR